MSQSTATDGFEKWLWVCLILLHSARSFEQHDKKPFNPNYPNCTDHPPKQNLYHVHVVERNAVRNQGASLISFANHTSTFRFNFNAAWFDVGGQEGLVVRVVDFYNHPEWSNAGALAVVPVDLMAKPMTSNIITEESITWAGTQGPVTKEVWGAADPRITHRSATGEYYLTWDNCTHNCWPQRVTYLSTTANPFNSSAWQFHGAVFPLAYSGGAALLFQDHLHHPLNIHYAFVGNSNTADKIYIVESTDGRHWHLPNATRKSSSNILLEGRPHCWDAAGVAVGPQPELLSTGDYLMIYNIDTGWPYHPNPLGRCSVGWAILDGDNPTRIVARATEPLLQATQPWETCEPHRLKDQCQVAEVVFATGLKRLVKNEFLVVYGGADSVVGVARIKVMVQGDKETS